MMQEADLAMPQAPPVATASLYESATLSAQQNDYHATLAWRQRQFFIMP